MRGARLLGQARLYGGIRYSKSPSTEVALGICIKTPLYSLSYALSNELKVIPYSFVYTRMLEFTCTAHKAVAEFGIFCDIFAFSSQLIVPNVELTWKFPSSACITVATCLYCREGQWISEVLSTQVI